MRSIWHNLLSIPLCSDRCFHIFCRDFRPFLPGASYSSTSGAEKNKGKGVIRRQNDRTTFHNLSRVIVNCSQTLIFFHPLPNLIDPFTSSPLTLHLVEFCRDTIYYFSRSPHQLLLTLQKSAGIGGGRNWFPIPQPCCCGQTGRGGEVPNSNPFSFYLSCPGVFFCLHIGVKMAKGAELCCGSCFF